MIFLLRRLFQSSRKKFLQIENPTKIHFLKISVLLGFFTYTAFAGNTGKISGVVKDAKTGEALIGASVMIDGTSYGAATNFDGYYVILNIPPGKYTLSSSAIGYNKQTITNISVSIDLTTTIDFQLQSSVVEMKDEVVIVAERPLVQKDLTAKTAVVGSEQISALPVTEVGAVLSLQAGFVAGSLRGGRSGEVAYWIDGVPVTDAFNGSQVVEVNKSLVQELQLVSGAFNAEYGQAMSGIVNIATKEGGAKFVGGFGVYGGDYFSTNTKLFPGLNKPTPYSIRNIEANISGPILGDELTFFANGRYIYFGGYLNGIRKFTPSNISYTDNATQKFILYRDSTEGMGDGELVPMNDSERKYGQAKLTWRITPLMKVSVNSIYDNTKAKVYDGFNEKSSYFYNPDGYGNTYTVSLTNILQFTHTLNSSTFYNIGASYFDKDVQYYVYENPHDPKYTHPDLFKKFDFYSFYTGGTDLNRSHRYTKTFLGKVDLSSQITESHLIKVGVEGRRHEMFSENITLVPIDIQKTFNPATSSPYITTEIPEISSNLHSKSLHNPLEFAAYVQDKMEFKSMIVNIGVRFDYFEPDGVILRDPSDPSIYSPIKPSNRFHDVNGNGFQDAGETDKTVAERKKYWYKNATSKYGVSPRLGFSFPITDRGIVHFSYGHFLQIPRFERLYENPEFELGLGTGNVGVVGNADLDLEQTVSGEIGLQQQLTDDISADVTAYLRDIRNLAGTRGEEIIIFGGASKYSKYINSDFGFVKGIVLTVNKRFSDGLTATIDYTYQIAKGSASDPQESRNAVAGGSQPEVQLNPLGWDQRNTLNVTISYAEKNWGASSIAQYGSGTPYTPRSSQDISTILTNTQNKPQFFNMDIRAYYEIPFDILKCVVFARVFNILDIRNETNVFDDTGRAGFTTDEARVKATNPKEYVNTIEQRFTLPIMYSEPRRIEFGVNVEF